MRKNTRPARRATATKVIASVALLAGAASVAGMGTFGAFTDTTTADQTVATGTVVLTDDLTNKVLSADVAGMVPGDSIERPVTLSRGGDSAEFGTVTLTTISSKNTLLTSDVTNGLQVTIDACAKKWTVDTVTKTMTCADEDKLTAPLDEGAVLGADRELRGVAAMLNADGKTYLRVKLALPKTADNNFKTLDTTVNFAVTATQRAGKAI